MKRERKSTVHLQRIVLVLCLAVVSIYSLTVGVKEFSLSGLLSGAEAEVNLAIISRIPRLVAILVTGASLSIAGIIMQTMTSNKFVSPSTIGTIEWCRLGVLIAILLAGGQSKFMKIIIAFFVALTGTMLFMQLLGRIQYKNQIMIPLIGLMFGNVVSAITSYFAYRYDIIQNMSSWLQGNFSLVIKGNYEILYLGIPVLFIAYLYANQFTIVGMGDTFAKNLGINEKLIVTIGMSLVAFITAIVVVTVGSVPFVGLIVPNLVALYKGDHLKNTLFDTALLGSLFVLVCDLIGRSIIAPYEIGISVVVSIIGSILFLILILRKKG